MEFIFKLSYTQIVNAIFQKQFFKNCKAIQVFALLLCATLIAFYYFFPIEIYFQKDDRWDQAYLFYAQAPHTDSARPNFETPRRLASVLVLSGNGSFYFVNVDRGGTFLDFRSGMRQGRYKVYPNWGNQSAGKITFSFHDDRSSKTYEYVYADGLILCSQENSKYKLVAKHIIELRSLHSAKHPQ